MDIFKYLLDKIACNLWKFYYITCNSEDLYENLSQVKNLLQRIYTTICQGRSRIIYTIIFFFRILSDFFQILSKFFFRLPFQNSFSDFFFRILFQYSFSVLFCRNLYNNFPEEETENLYNHLSVAQPDNL